MSGTVLIPLIVVLWLFVLAPWLLRAQQPIRKAGEAFNETRVVYEGGAGEVIAGGAQRPRRRLRPPAAAKRPGQEPVLNEEILGAVEDCDIQLPAEDFEEIEEPTLVAELLALEEEPWEPVEVVAAVDEDGFYEVDDSYLEPGDLLYTDESTIVSEDHSTAPEVDENTEDGWSDEEDLADDLSEEDRAFAEMRRGRGGYDPERDASASVSRYQRRQRTVLGLIAVLTISFVAAFIIGAWAWSLPAIVGAATTIYLLALRRQVHAEQQLRQRRIRQLRRARLGVRSAHDEELRIPHRLRRPGAIVVETDDESPDFAHLDMVRAGDYISVNNGPGTVTSLDDRRVG